MESYPAAEQVLADLGDKPVAALATAMGLARDDLSTYRSTFPAWVAEASERGLASWIHDRVWYHLSALVDEIDDVVLLDREPTRELWVKTTYRVRIKRHHVDGRVSTYPTQTALEFLAQGAGQLRIEGLEEVHLIAGYLWDRDVREVGDPVLSLRDGNVIWIERLLQPNAGTGGAPVPLPTTPEPTMPTIDVTVIEPAEDDEAGSS